MKISSFWRKKKIIAIFASFSGETENPRITLNDSEVIMEIMDDVRKQLGVVYDVD